MLREAFESDPETNTFCSVVVYQTPPSKYADPVGRVTEPLTRDQVIEMDPGFVAKTARALGLQ